MNLPQKVVLSLGSNQGNRLENIENAIALIQSEMGLIQSVSNVYESTSWGFDGEVFYNCALYFYSSLPPEILLEKAKFIENKLGRTAKVATNYENRIIDIDIVAINDLVFKSSLLIIPHEHMQNRLFVLQPIQDLKLDWKHPILQKNVTELITICADKNECKIINQLKLPNKNYQINHLNYIAIEGNIGAGKTSLAIKIATDFNAKMILERFADNPFLPKFYEDQSRFAFPLEMSFLADRYQQLSDDISQFDLFKDFVVADYHIFKSLIFAKVTLQEDEFRLYKTLFDIIYKEMPKPDLYVYLYQKTDRLLSNIKNRGRSYEQEIPEDYLEKINQGYLDYIKSQTNLNSLIIDVTEMDFVNNHADYLKILDAIRCKIDG